jgi:hypothetical protein
VSFPRKRESPFQDLDTANRDSRFRGNDIVVKCHAQ